MANFPNICPTSRKFTAAQFPTRRFNSISGAGTTRLYGSKAFDAKLDMQFMVNDDTAESIFDCWYGGYGTYQAVTLPDDVVSGDSDLLDAMVPDYLEWHWEKEPTIETIHSGLSRVTVNLVAHLEI